jgi:hypothetical protein
MSLIINTEIFINNAKKEHGDKYYLISLYKR